jgi:hypothetical protein
MSKFAFIPKAQYTIGQIITVHGKPMMIVSYSHTGKNVVVTSIKGKHEKITCICTNNPPIEAVTE